MYSGSVENYTKPVSLKTSYNNIGADARIKWSCRLVKIANPFSLAHLGVWFSTEKAWKVENVFHFPRGKAIK